MATGVLGASAPVLNTNTTVYTVPTAKIATCIISLCNRGITDTKVRIALAAAAAPTTAEYIEYDVSIPPNGVLERTGIVLQAAKRVVVYADTGYISAVIFGFEE